MRPIIRSTRFWIAAAVVAAASAGTAYASIPESDGVIHACYAKSGGTLRVIDASVTNCKSTETSLTWDQHGQPGPQGPQGEPGPAGPQGEPGAPGGLAGYEQVTVDQQTNPDVSIFTSATATCPVGKVAVGGGGEILDPTKAGTDVVLDASRPINSRQWRAEAHGFVPDFNWTLRVTVICANAA